MSEQPSLGMKDPSGIACLKAERDAARAQADALAEALGRMRCPKFRGHRGEVKSVADCAGSPILAYSGCQACTALASYREGRE